MDTRNTGIPTSEEHRQELRRMETKWEERGKEIRERRIKALENIDSVILPEEGSYPFLVVEVGYVYDTKDILVGFPGSEHFQDAYDQLVDVILPEQLHPGKIYGYAGVTVTGNDIEVYRLMTTSPPGFFDPPEELVTSLLEEYVGNQPTPMTFRVRMD